MRIEPNGQRVLVRTIPKPSQTATGIHKPTSADDGPRMVVVLAVGKEVKEFKAGDHAYAGRFAGSAADMIGRDFIMVEEELLAKVYPDSWVIYVLPVGGATLDEAIMPPIVAEATAIVHVDDDGGAIVTTIPTTLPDASRRALLGNEFVRVVAVNLAESRHVVLFKVPTNVILRQPLEFNARAIKEDAFGREETVAPSVRSDVGQSGR